MSFIRLGHQLLAGVSVRSASLKGDQVVRAVSMSARCQANRLSFPGRPEGQRLVPTSMLSSPVCLCPKIANRCERGHESVHAGERVIKFVAYALQVLVLTLPQPRS